MNGGYYAASPDPSFLITGVPSPFEVTGISYPTITEDDPKNRPKVSALREVIGGSCKALQALRVQGIKFPSPPEVTRGYYVPKIAFKYKLSKVPVPSRGDWGL